MMLISSRKIQPERLRQNKYFEEMHRKGYNIHVYQSEFMDFCAGYENMVVSCHTNRDTGIEPLAYLDLSAPMKAWLALDTSRLSVLCRGFDYRYNDLRQAALRHGYELPQWVLNRFTLWAVRGVRALQEIEDDVSAASAGEMFSPICCSPTTLTCTDPLARLVIRETGNSTTTLRCRRTVTHPVCGAMVSISSRSYVSGPGCKICSTAGGKQACMTVCSSSFRATMAQGSGAPADRGQQGSPGALGLHRCVFDLVRGQGTGARARIRYPYGGHSGSAPGRRERSSRSDPRARPNPVLLETQPPVLAEDGTDMVRQPMPAFGDPEGEGSLSSCLGHRVTASEPARVAAGLSRQSTKQHQAPGGEWLWPRCVGPRLPQQGAAHAA